MNAVEIEEAISGLAEEEFDPDNFPFLFLEAFGNKKATIDRLRRGDSNGSEIEGGVLQRNHIHMAVCAEGEVSGTLVELRASKATQNARNKVKFILATDGVTLEAEELNSDEAPVVCEYKNFPDHFGFFLPLAGITTVREIRESSFDIKATGRLNRLYVELLKNNTDWDTEDRRHDMNHFMARLIFCFFAEDTDIFIGDDLFTASVDQMSERDSSNTHEVIGNLFRAMNTEIKDRESAKLPRWADTFPYVNGGLFSGDTEVPRFSKIARSYLLHIGRLDWKKINPDIFGSMIQAVADDEERGALGMHYTSVPNILKVLNPLFLDDLRGQLEAAGDNGRMLLNLRKRMAKIRVFDPACGSGNFLVIAYKEMRAIEAEVNDRRNDPDERTTIPLTNFRGIEIRDFAAEIARLALIIAEYQCDVLYRGQQVARDEFLPLNEQNWITCGNALRLDWLFVCPPTGKGVKMYADDLLHIPNDQKEIDFKNEGGETYICGNPPYLGSTWQSSEQKSDLEALFKGRAKNWKSLDYVAGWFMKAADYGTTTNTVSAFVSTNSICQGAQVPILWPVIFATGHNITFAHTSFKWANLAKYNAGVTVAIVGIAIKESHVCHLFYLSKKGETELRKGDYINAYLAFGSDTIVSASSRSIFYLPEMVKGNQPTDGGNLLMTREEKKSLNLPSDIESKFVRRIYGSYEFINGQERYCLWIDAENATEALSYPTILKRAEAVRKMRLESPKKATNEIAGLPYRFGEVRQRDESVIVVPSVSSERREYLPAGLLSPRSIVSNLAFALFDAPLWNMALVVSRLHLVWIGAVCGRLETRFHYSNTLGWNTFPVPKLTEKNKEDLTQCAEDILLAREKHFPKTIADLYKQDAMPDNLRDAHERNDEVLERIYIGRRFKNDTERLEKLFVLYAKMIKDKNLPTTVPQRKTSP